MASCCEPSWAFSAPYDVKTKIGAPWIVENIRICDVSVNIESPIAGLLDFTDLGIIKKTMEDGDGKICLLESKGCNARFRSGGECEIKVRRNGNGSKTKFEYTMTL